MYMNKRIRFYSIIMALVMAGSLAGCSLEQFVEDKVHETAYQPTEAPPTTTETTVPTEPTQLADLVTGGRFRGSQYNRIENEYTDVDYIDYVVDLSSEASGREIIYSYTITLNGEIVGSGENITASDPTALECSAQSNGVFDEGHVVVDVRDENGSLLNSAECDVTMTPELQWPGVPQAEYEPDGSFFLPGTQLHFTPLDDYIVTEDMIDTVYTREQARLAGSTYCYGFYPDTGEFSQCGYSVFFVAEADIDTYDIESHVERGMITQARLYEEAGVSFTRSQFDVQMGDRLFTCYVMQTVPSDGSPSVSCVYYLVGNDEYVYCLSGMSPEEDFAHRLTGALTYEGNE